MRSIFYTTYGAYKNCGSFFDYLKEYFPDFIFLDLKSHHTNITKKTTLFIYHKQKLTYERELFTPLPDPPVFLIPVYHFIYMFNIVQALYITRTKFKIKPDYFITSFSMWALGGCIGRALGLCSKVILWSWDYYPLYKDNPYYFIQLLLQPFESLAIKLSDYSWYASKSNFDIRVKVKQIVNPKDPKHRVVHWGTGGSLKKPNIANYTKTKKLKLIYFGAIHYEKGITLVTDSIHALIAATKGNLEFLIIGGDSPLKDKLKNQIQEGGHEKYVKFKDFINNSDFSKISKDYDLGIALFVPRVGGKINFSYYADPGKPRDYLASGLPMLITKVPAIYKDIKKYNAGIVLEAFNEDALVKAVKLYMSSPQKYMDGAFNLSQIDRYDKYYSKQFLSIDGNKEN